MIARIDTADKDVSKTIVLLEKEYALKAGPVTPNWSISITKLTELNTILVKLESSLNKLINITNNKANNTETSTAVDTNNNLSDMKTTIPGNNSEKPTLTKNAGKADKISNNL